MFFIFTPIFAITIATLWIVELFLLGTWNKFYFYSGIKLFSKSVHSAENLYMDQAEIDYLNHKLKHSILPNIKFKNVGKNAIGFREQYFGFSFINYPPLMHGLITQDKDQGVIIKGLSNWSIFALLFILTIPLSFTFSTFGFSMFSFSFLIPIVFILLFFFLQKSRFKKVSEEIQILVDHYNAEG